MADDPWQISPGWWPVAERVTARHVAILGAGLAAAALGCYLFIDMPLAHAIRNGPKALREFGSACTDLGDANLWFRVLPVAALTAFVLRRLDAIAWCLLALATVAASGLAVNLLKFIFGRARPGAMFERDHFGFTWFASGYHYVSMPSGHAATVAALCTAVWLLRPRWSPMLIAAFVAVAGTRVMVNAHYPSDVLAGGFVGFVTTLLLARGLNTLAPKSRAWWDEQAELELAARHTR